ncbi:unnamed protein product, partial [Symbiodinium sp. CCMP2456]
NAVDSEEWQSAEEVVVQLAGNKSLTMRLGASGSLLMPPRPSATTTTAASTGGQTIVPLGELVKTLGYTLIWSPDGCILRDPEGLERELKVSGGCPHLQEAEALSMIARLEDRKRERLENVTAITMDRVTLAAASLDKSWIDHLKEYVKDGTMEAGLKSVRDSPFLQDIPGDCINGLIQAGVREEGWKIMKGIDFLTRPQKRHLWAAKKWVVHLFAGSPGHNQFFQLDEGDTVVLELDVNRCRGQDVLRDPVWRLLLWGAMTGRIDGIIGGPPGRGARLLHADREGGKDTKALSAITRMLWLYAVSKAAREVGGTPHHRDRPVAFVIEHPAEEVRGSQSLWRTAAWKEFKEEMDMSVATFDQATMGGVARNVTTIGTNVYYLMGLDGLRPADERDEVTAGSCDNGDWSPGLVDGIVMALSHADYNRECLTCVTSRGLDATSKGTLGKNLRYLMIAKYVFPAEYVKGYTGRGPPDDDGLEEEGPIYHDEDESGEQGYSGNLESILGGKVPVFAGSSSAQRADYEKEDWDDSMYEPSIPELDQVKDDGDEDLQAQAPASQAQNSPVPFPDCEAPKTTYLLFARALPSNTTASVKGALQDVILYLGAHGLPVYRLHSDKGETYSHSMRNWLKEQGIRATYSEAGIPQGNGRVENAVRWVKDRSRSLLLGAGLPTRLWPTAIEAATAMQRSKVLGWKQKMLAPYGARVHIKQKAFDSSGPRRRERAFETRWESGVYVGLSNLLDNGHVVYVPGKNGERERFVHTFHVRSQLRDPGPPVCPELIPHMVKPRRKLTTKTPAEHVELRSVNHKSLDLDDYVGTKARLLLEEWNQEEAVKLVDELAEAGFFDELKFGIFRHGGAVGWMRGFSEHPELSKVLSRIILTANPEATFTAILVGRNMDKGMHKDVNNDENALNYVYPIRLPKKGGELWVELSAGDKVSGEIVERMDDQQPRYGQVMKLKGKIHQLESHGYPPPLSQLPEYFLKTTAVVNQMNAEGSMPMPGPSTIQSEEEIVVDPEVEDWEMFLDLDGGYVKIGDSSESPEGQLPGMFKLEVGYTKGIEKILDGLTAPLEVTYNVDPREVAANLPAWTAAIEKEVNGVAVAIRRLLPGTAERAEWLQRPGAQRLPTKMVFTIKPGDSPVADQPSTWYKRKARLVVCGNYATSDNSELYSETAPSESVRTPLDWSKGRTVTAWWVLRDKRDIVKAVIIIYVDDLLLLGEEELIKDIATTVQREWKTSELMILRPRQPLRFLGMELEVNETETTVYLSQRGYLEEVLRSYGFKSDEKDKIPLSKEAAYFETIEGDEEPTPQSIAEAQKITGEVMWVAHKTRPDVSFTSCLMAAITLKAPARCVEIGFKWLRYLQATKDTKMAVQDDGTSLMLYPDAAFAPSSGRSHTGWLVCWGGTPISWRSARQGAITLSTAESELQAIIDGSVGMMGLEAMLMDLHVEPEPKVIASDSTSAIAIGSGTGSWRTRHLRLKSAWIQEKIASGEIVPRHQPGLHQPADLLTKPLAAQRIWDLLKLWGMAKGESDKVRICRASQTAITTRMLVAMVCCLMMISVEARESSAMPALQVDWDLAAILMILLMILGGLMIYEAVRWSAIEIYYQYLPGATTRRMRRLQRLRKATAQAIEKEIEEHMMRTQPSTSSSGSSTLMADTPPRRRPPTPPVPEQDQRDYAISPLRRRTVRQDVGYSQEPPPSPIPGTPPAAPSISPPTISVSQNLQQGDRMSVGETSRVCLDVVMLMRLEEIREGLRLNGLMISGVKTDAASRLAEVLSSQLGTSVGPTVRQMKYLLWLWRDRNLSGRALLTWSCLRSREEASRTIAKWKEL